jgi:hypothetical protein
MSLNTYLSALKWRLIDRAMRRPVDTALPRSTSFALTSVGAALGQVLPIQVSMSMARTLGIWVHGPAVRRGTVGTLFEQAFDFAIVCFLLIASAATRLLHGKAMMWMAFAVPMVMVAILSVGALTRVLRWVGSGVTSSDSKPARWRCVLADLQQSPLLEPGLGRQLMALSTARFVVFVMIVGQTSAAIRSDVPFWQLAAAMPFVIFSSAVAIVPGGLGVAEWSWAAALGLFGTPLVSAAQWALVNRLLACAAAFVIAIFAVTFVLITKMLARLRYWFTPASAARCKEIP